MAERLVALQLEMDQTSANLEFVLSNLSADQSVASDYERLTVLVQGIQAEIVLEDEAQRESVDLYEEKKSLV